MYQLHDELEEEEQDEEDHDFVPNDNDGAEDAATNGDNLALEVQDLKEDEAGSSSNSRASSAPNGLSALRPRRSSRKRSENDTNDQGLGIQLRRSLGSSNRLDSNDQDSWIRPYENRLLDEYYDGDGDGDRNHSRSKKIKRAQPQSMTRTVLAPRETLSSPERESRRGSMSSQVRNVRFEDEDAATLIAMQDKSDSDEEHSEAISESTSISSESDKENVRPDPSTQKKRLTGNPPASSPTQPGELIEKAAGRRSASSKLNGNSTLQASSSEPTDESSEESTSSSGISSSDSESTSESESDSDGYLESEHPSIATKPSTSPSQSRTVPPSSSKSNKVNGTLDKTSTSATTSQQKIQQNPPGQGQKKTRLRNQRRRVHSRLQKLKGEGKVPNHFTAQDYLNWEEERVSQQEQRDSVETAQVIGSIDEDLAAALEAKKAELLRSSEGEPNGQVASNETLQTMVDDHSHLTSNETLQAMTDDHDQVVPNSLNWTAQDEMVTDQTKGPSVNGLQDSDRPVQSASVIPSIPANKNETPQTVTTDTKPNKRRTKLDVASTRRMLFGSLGVRVPKTQEEEDVVRKKLSAKTRVAPQPKPDASLKLADPKPEEVVADDSWKNKITLKAVECCHEGVELSTPPFPFVQRWDPQQRGDFNHHELSKNGSSKKRKRRASKYYENSRREPAEEYVFEERGLDAQTREREPFRHNELDLYPTLSEEYKSAANEQLLRDSGVLSTNAEVAVNDLPELPTDIETYSALVPDTALQGSIIAFQQLEVSARTCWQPQVSEYRVATIEGVLPAEEGGALCLKLATHGQGRNTAEFDPATGERIYGKFEMPMFGEDDGNDCLEIAFGEMIEPKLIKPSLAVAKQVEDHEKGVSELVSLVQVEETPQEDSIIGSKTTHTDEHARSTSFVEDSVKQEKRHESDNVEKPLWSDGPDSVSRKEVSLLIKGAGFRTSIDPEAVKELEGPDKGTEADLEDREANEGDDRHSVQSSFVGFGSSSPRSDDDEDMFREETENGEENAEQNENEEPESSEEGDDDEQGYNSTSSKPIEGDTEQDHEPDLDSHHDATEEMEEGSHSMAWYAAKLRGNDDGGIRSRERSPHDRPVDTTENSNFEGASTDKPVDNTDVWNLDGTTEISNLDGASYDMIGTQAVPKLSSSSPNPLPSLMHMSPAPNNLPPADLSDQLPETIPPTSTSNVNGDSSPHQQSFRDSPQSTYSQLVDEMGSSSSSIRQSRGRKTLVVRGGYDSNREVRRGSSSESESYKPSSKSETDKRSEDETASDPDTALHPRDNLPQSQPLSKKTPIHLSCDPFGPESSSPPPTRASKTRTGSLTTTKKQFKVPKKTNQTAGPTASQQKANESLPQSQTQIKEEQPSQRRSLFDHEPPSDANEIDSHDFLEIQPPKRASGNTDERTAIRASEDTTKSAEPFIVDLTQDSDLQSPGGSDYGGGKSVRGSKGRRNGARETQSFGGEGIRRDPAKATRKRVVERTRSRV